VARIEPVVARAAAQDVALDRVVVSRIPVAPEDVVAAAAGERVAAVAAVELVVERAARQAVGRAAVVDDLPQDPAELRPLTGRALALLRVEAIVVRDLLAAARRLAVVARTAADERAVDPRAELGVGLRETGDRDRESG
jgi:hypothetical protein